MGAWEEKWRWVGLGGGGGGGGGEGAGPGWGIPRTVDGTEHAQVDTRAQC